MTEHSLEAHIDTLTALDRGQRKLLLSSAARESFLGLDNELYLRFGNEPFCLALTSAIRGEGKTTFTLLLSILSTHFNPQQEVLVIDSCHDAQAARLLGFSGIPLSESSISAFDPAASISGSGIPNLHVASIHATNGDRRKLPHAQLEMLIAYGRQHYARVFVDTGSGSLSKENISVGRMAGCSLIIIQYRCATREQIQALLSELMRVNCEVMGTVLNKRRFALPRFLYGR